MDCKERIICDILSVLKTKSFEKKNDVTLITHRSCALVHNKMLQEINSKPLPLSDIYDSKKKDAKGGQKNLLFHQFFLILLARRIDLQGIWCVCIAGNTILKGMRKNVKLCK